MSTLHVGIDLSLKSITCAATDPAGDQRVKKLVLGNTPDGVETLVAKILAVSEEHAIRKVRIGVEATGNLGWHIVAALLDHPDLQSLCPEVYLFNPQQVKTFKGVLTEQSKTDSYDAYILAERLRFGNLPRPYRPDQRFQSLQVLTRQRFHLVENLSREKNRFLNQIFLKFSAFRQIAIFSDPFGATSGAVLTDFLSVEEIAHKSLDELAAFVQDKARGAFPEPEKIAEAIQKAARNSFRLDKPFADAVNAALASIMANIRFLEKAIKDIEKVIEKQVAALAEYTILRSIPGIGPVFAAGILAEIQNINRFGDDGALARFAAIVWRHSQSGEHTAEDTRLMRSGNTYLRYYLIEAANSLRMHNEEYREYYQRKFAEAAKHPHKRACVLTARKLVRLIFILLQNGQLYQQPAERKEAKRLQEPPDPQAVAVAVRHIVRKRQARRTKAAA